MRGDICALSSSDDVLAPFGCMWQKQYGFLRLAHFVAGGDCATIQDTAKLAYGRFKVSDPLRWDILIP